ncbi:MAG: hypothetical protein AB8B99_10320 [Phormidesmis sp.]
MLLSLSFENQFEIGSSREVSYRFQSEEDPLLGGVPPFFFGGGVGFRLVMLVAEPISSAARPPFQKGFTSGAKRQVASG